MKQVFAILIFTSLFALSSCESDSEFNASNLEKENAEYYLQIDTFLLGDINSDGIEDTAFSTSPYYNSNEGCKDSICLTTIQFSFNSNLLYHEGALGCQTLLSLEDLNADGINEIGFIPNWFQSCWQGLFVYSLSNNVWTEIGSGDVFACNHEDFSKRVKKLDSTKFEITSMKWSDDGGELIDTVVIYEIE